MKHLFHFGVMTLSCFFLLIFMIWLSMTVQLKRRVATAYVGRRVSRLMLTSDTVITTPLRSECMAPVSVTQEFGTVHRAFAALFRPSGAPGVPDGMGSVKCQYFRRDKLQCTIRVVMPCVVNFGDYVDESSYGGDVQHQGLIDSNCTVALIRMLSATGLDAKQCFPQWSESLRLLWAECQTQETQTATER